MLTFSHYVFKVSNMQSDKYALISDGIKEFAICIFSKNFDVMKRLQECRNFCIRHLEVF